jgi:probable HAF family extracellular repeat protein
MSFKLPRHNLTASLLSLAFVGTMTSCATPIDDAEENAATGESELPLVAGADLGALTGASGKSQAFAINEHGTIVGYSSDSTGAPRAVIWVSRRLTALPVPAGTTISVALDVNVNGVAVGWRKDANGRTRAVRWTGTSSVADLAPGFNGDSTAEAINDRGEIVGWSRPTGGAKSAVRFVNGTVVLVLPPDPMGLSVAADIGNRATGTNSILGQAGSRTPFEQGNTPPGTPGNFMALPVPSGTSYTGVNGASGDGNAAVGWFRISTGPRRAAMWRANVVPPNTFPSSWTVQDLGTLGGPSSAATGINPAGTIVVGTSDRASGASHGFSRRIGSSMVDLGALSSDPGCVSAAYGINSAGTIVGFSCTSGSSGQHAVAWN